MDSSFYLTDNEFDGAQPSFEFRCKDGTISVNKNQLLSSKFSDFLKEKDINFIDLHENTTAACKLFLDILMEFIELKRNDALLILPIAKRFGIIDLYQKCVIILKPVAMDPIIIETLNVAVAHGCEYLKDSVTDFLLSYGMNLLFLQKEYYLLLSPKSVLVLLKIIEKNDMIFSSIIEWGRHYIKENNIADNLRAFFVQTKIFDKFTIDNLSSECILKSYQIDVRNNVFTAEEILNHLTKVAKSVEANWTDTKEDEMFTEIFDLEHSVVVSTGTELTFQFNPVIYEYSASKENFKVFECKIKLLLTHFKNNDSEENALEVTAFKMLKNEIAGLHCERSVMIQNNENTEKLVLTDIIINFNFYKNSKILLTKTDLPSIFKKPRKLTFVKSISL